MFTAKLTKIVVVACASLLVAGTASSAFAETAWDANHPLNDFADVLLPGTIHVEKEGTYTNLQGRVQEIHAAYPPKGQAVSDLEIFARIAARVFAASAPARVKSRF